jgi:hypothetical protein
MLAAVVTVAVHGEYAHAILPIVMLSLIAIVGGPSCGAEHPVRRDRIRPTARLGGAKPGKRKTPAEWNPAGV